MADSAKQKIDLVEIRTKLESSVSARSWRSLGELAETEEFKSALLNEFPQLAETSAGKISRREALRFMGASAALAGLTACTKLPTEKIVPYVQAPEEIIPGKPLYYATSMTQGGVASGVVATSTMGRPTKIEGNPDHPGSLGAADIYSQNSALTLYDPDRSQVISHEGRIRSWSDVLTVVDELRAKSSINQGAGLRFLTETITSPTLIDQLRDILKQFPKAKWHQYEPAGRDNVRAGARLAFGDYVETIYRFDQADVIVALDADFLGTGATSVRYAHDFADKRRVTGPESVMNRLYVVESSPSITGAHADHRFPIRSGAVQEFAAALASGLGLSFSGPRGAASEQFPWIPALVRDLQNHRGSSIVIAGDGQPPAVHAIVHAINAALGNSGKTVLYTDPIEGEPINQMQSLLDLVSDMGNGQVETLVIIEGNPVYSAPADLRFAENLNKVNLRIHLSLYDDETSELCHWHIAGTHYLEMWSDGRAFDGTVSLVQPLISPLYNGKSAHELLAAFQGQPGRTPHEIVREYWQRQQSGANFEAFWETSLEKGVMAGSAYPPKPVRLNPKLGTLIEPAKPSGGGLEIVFRPDPTIGDGRFANSGWLQELPKPHTKLTWDNAALVSPKAAERLGLNNGDVVELDLEGVKVKAPIWITPGHADDSVTAHLGYGRTRAGNVGTGRGFNAYPLVRSGSPHFAPGLTMTKTGETYQLVATQEHHLISSPGGPADEESVAAERRDLIREATLEEFRKNPDFAKDPASMTTNAQSLYPGFKDEEYSWAMSIDLNSCTGCNACVLACQAENNIAVVGKDQVSRGREMHWIRIDTYFTGSLDNPAVYHEPVPCMMCENAPCEPVCPVGATVHSPEGLNEMVYNRCVGTRYCSNNCPYKVRRFNFLLYSDWNTPSLYGLRNPNVSVRSRGVMEKCTYCVQRINARKIKSEEQNREVRDGEIQTACQQTCPAQAIVFGNLKDPNSRVSKLKAQSRDFSLVAELNTRPRTTYLARLRNPNPEIKE